MIYLDYNASTPIDDDVLDLYYDTTKYFFANPKSNHNLGKKSKDIIDGSTKRISILLNVENNKIIYTSGEYEANNLAIRGVINKYKNIGKHIIISSIENEYIKNITSSLIKDGFEVDTISINNDGVINIDELKDMIRKDTILVCICAVSDELGLKQPIEDIGLLLKNYPNVHFLCDASRSISTVNINFENVDLITLSSSKIGGINNIGLLVTKDDIINDNNLFHYDIPDTASIVSLSLALDKVITNYEKRYDYVLNIYKSIIDDFKTNDYIHINNKDNSIPYIINIDVKGLDCERMIKLLEEKNIYVTVEHSSNESDSKIKISLSHLTTKDEVTNFLNVFNSIIKENIK